VLVVGSKGTLGRRFLEKLGDRAAAVDLPGMDITDQRSVERAVVSHSPSLIINCAALTDVDLCETRPELAMEVHCTGVANLARTGIKVVSFSTDHIFSGVDPSPFVESDDPDPVNEYAWSKLRGERRLLEISPHSIVVRTSWLFDRESGLPAFLLDGMEREGSVTAVSDQSACLTYAPDLVQGVMEIIDSGGSGVYHLVNGGVFTPLGLARMLADEHGEAEVVSVSWDDLGLAARRPRYSVLGTERGCTLPDAGNALARWRRSRE
jgi:dTDP-4-dehydrorhamnose reductase